MEYKVLFSTYSSYRGPEMPGVTSFVIEDQSSVIS